MLKAIMVVSMTVFGQSAELTHLDTMTDGLAYPGRIASSPGGGLYVTDQASGVIVEYDAVGAVVDTYAIAEGPIGVAALGPDVFVSRSDGQVGRYDGAFGLQELLDPSPFGFMGPNDLAVDPVAGELYVADGPAHRVLVFSDTGGGWGLDRVWGTQGSGMGEFQFPLAIAVDAALGRVLVTDADNFRVQVFDTSGVFLFRFGYRIAYTSMGELAWLARGAGIAVDSCGNIYVTDSLMGTLRVFDVDGHDLELLNPPVRYGTSAGDLRTPCDVMIRNDVAYVANTTNAGVELYDILCTGLPAPSRGGDPAVRRDTVGRDDGLPRMRGALAPDNPFEIVAVMNSGEYDRRYDLNLDRQVDVKDLKLAVQNFGAATVEDFLAYGPSPAAPMADYEGPHIVPGLATQCGRCHDFDGMPLDMTSAAGQANLCMSCHTSSGLANGSLIPAPDRGAFHPIGVPADGGVSDGPDPASASQMAFHLDNGDIRCGTCHNQHSQEQGDPYVRATVENSKNLCGECHRAQGNEWLHAGHADTHADAWGHYDWALPNRAACRKCHSGNGFIDFSKGKPDAKQNGMFRVLDCATCHGVHQGVPGEELLRIYDDITLPGDVTFNDKGPNATCMTCHNGRTVPADGATPHYALGGVMFEGINANEFGATILNSAHTTVAQCVDCHMAPGPAAGPGAGKVGGHSFALKVHDPADPDFGFENVEGACNAAACHGDSGALTTINRTAYGDYDGDGAVEGVQDEVAGLMDLVFDEIIASGAEFLGGYPYWRYTNVVDDPPGFLQTVQRSVWNWEYVDNSGDFGIHNTGYAVGILQVTYAQLTGNAVPGADLRYTPAGFGPTVVEVQEVNGGGPVVVGNPFTVDFTIEDGDGDPIDRADVDRLLLYVAGPSSNYQRVIAGDSAAGNFVQNPDGTYTYSIAAFPAVYLAPLNNSPAFGPADGELTGLAIMEGTYTVLIESRRSFGSIRKAGDGAMDFVVADNPAVPPALSSRQFVTRDRCNDCHNDLQIHGRNRFAVTGCVFCHTRGAEDYITAPDSTPGLTIQLGDMIHKIHRGHAQRSIEATADGADPYRYIIRGHNGNPADFSDIGFPVIPMGIIDCEACHGGAAQEASIFTNVTRANCGGCHEDLDFVPGGPVAGLVLDEDHAAFGTLTAADLDDPAFRIAPDGITHAFVDDTGCTACHDPAEVMEYHTHPTSLDAEGTLPALEIVSVGGMTGGGGAYFVAGDFPAITFKLSDVNDDPLELVAGDKSVVDRIDFILAGPTTLYQTIITAKSPWSNGNLVAPVGNWVDNFAVDGTYTYTLTVSIPAVYPAQLNALGEPPADQVFPYGEGWGQQYTVGGTPLDTGTYTVFGYGRRLTPTDGEREPILSDQFDIAFGADEPMVPYAGTVETASCNACHGVLAFHGNQREGVNTCQACHTAGTQDGGTFESVDLRIMVHKLHNARNLDVVRQGGAYEMAGHSGITDFSHLLISSMPGEAAECQECHTTEAWKNPPMRDNMRTWMVACTSCHDAPATADHVDIMTVPGTFDELCVNCHGEGRLFAVQDVHATP